MGAGSWPQGAEPGAFLCTHLPISSVTQIPPAKSVVETAGAVEKPTNGFPTAP